MGRFQSHHQGRQLRPTYGEGRGRNPRESAEAAAAGMTVVERPQLRGYLNQLNQKAEYAGAEARVED